MQVSHQNDHITHAVIGGKQAIEFGISTSAEFFNILSSTLYKDQILAVVREVLCNAWDAHIEAKCTDRSVAVTLTNDTFSIKDFGNGIHHDDMGLIYGTYGNSTKKNDGAQTGGFGLGCKAPFAYIDHFEVVSCHAGVKTIYSLAKSSAQAMGKPGITPIASFPTDDSGLTVTIRVKPGDAHRFKKLIERIAYNGDMNIKLNGEQLSTLDFDVSTGNFLITRAKLLEDYHAILVRYGNVVYPVDACNELGDAIHAIKQHLQTLGGSHLYNPFALLFQAPAHSIAVTPSRESLSMQEHTINTLKSLFKGFLDSLENTFKPACDAYVKRITQQAVAAKRIDELLKGKQAFPVIETVELPQKISDFEEMARTYLHWNYPKGRDFRAADVTYRLNTLVQHNLLERGKVQTFLRELAHSKVEYTDLRGWSTGREKTSWLQRQVIAPLLVRLAKAGLPTQKLYSCSADDNNWNRRKETTPPLVPAISASPYHLLTTLPYLRNIVVITRNRQDLLERAYRHDVFKAAGAYTGFLVYTVGTRKGELEAVRQFFAQEGMRVVDLTLEKDSFDAYVRSRAPRKPTKKGVPKLSSILNGSRISISRFIQEDVERIEAPECIILLSLRSGNPTNYLPGWGYATSHTLVKLFGEKAGVTNNSAVYEKYISKGAVRFDAYVREKVCKYILNNPRIESYWAYSQKHLDVGFHASYLATVIYASAVLRQEFGLLNLLTEEDILYLDLWDDLAKNYGRYTPQKEISEVRDWLNTITPAPAVKDLGVKLQSPLVRFLDTGEVQRAFQDPDNKNQPKLIELIKSCLNP